MSTKQTKKTTANKKAQDKAKAASRKAAAKPVKAKTTRAASATSSGATPADGAVTKREPDARLPPVGTVIEKRDRHGQVRCACTVEDGGIRYNGTLYRSLSAAAMAAAADLELTNKTQNGYTFWGLSKPPRAPSDPMEALDRAWTRYHGKVAAIVKDDVTDENRTKVAAAIGKQAQVIETLHGRVS